MIAKQTSKVVALVYLAILALLPFHALLTTWAGSNFGNIDAWRIWKELLIFASVPLVAYLAFTDERCRNWLRQSWLPRLIALYMLLHIVWGFWALATDRVNGQALVYAWLINLRFLGFFLLCALVAMRSALLQRYAMRIVLATGVVVVAFGVLQITVLPHDFLRHFGYGPETIPAYQTVDNKLDYQRIQSTLRGANPLGAYLVVLLCFVVVEWLSPKKRSLKLIGYDIALVAALFFTYSRSAYLGALCSVAFIVWLSIRSAQMRRYLLLAALTVVTAGIITIVAMRDNDLVQNTLFHSDETSRAAESSNASRLRALQVGVQDVVSEPLGGGPGTAGPASIRNEGHTGRIAENYYIQIAQEVGLLGIALFVAINVMAGRMLWRMRQNWIALGLLASLVGLTVVNMVSHAWTDDTLSLIWWGLAGIVIGGGIINHKYNEATKKAKTRS